MGRHQADACHAYQIAKGHGIPESNIILLAYDDIAHNSQNPFPGKVFNKPTPAGVPGKDVYDGCKISYRGSDVTAENFLKVLSGDTSAPGPVLKSAAQDHVFVYYADHGGPGILGVPYGARGGYIHASDINKAIETLQSKGGYKELLFYLEACESGSIFNNLLKAPNAKAVTAANPRESSWGWYCPYSSGGDMVDGKSIGSCLGDEFSVRWMEDADASKLNSETVGQQFSKVRTAVTKSHVQVYGVHSFDAEPIGDFEGLKAEAWTQRNLVDDEGNELKAMDDVTASDCKRECEKMSACHSFSFSSSKMRCHLKDKCVTVDQASDHNPGHRGYVTYYKPCSSARITAMAPEDSVEGSGVDSRQVEVHQAYYQVMRAETAQKRKEAEQELETVLAQRSAADVKFAKIASAACETANCLSQEMLEGPIETFNMSCHKASLESVVEHCGSFTDYSLRYSRLFANLCEIGMDQRTMQKAIEKGCGKAVVV